MASHATITPHTTIHPPALPALVALYWTAWERLDRAPEDTTEQARASAALERVFRRMMEAPAVSLGEVADKAKALAHWETGYSVDIHLSGHPAARLWRDLASMVERGQ